MTTAAIDAYIDAAPEAGRATLRAVAEVLRAVAPDAVEAIKWRQPVWEGRRILFSLTAYQGYAAFMPTASTLDGFRAEVEAAGLETTSHRIKLPYGAPVPTELLRRIAEHRERDVREHDARWAGPG